MLYAHSHSILLNLLNIRYYHNRSEEWIFTHILEVAAIQRGTVNVHSRAQQHILLTETGFLTNGFAI